MRIKAVGIIPARWASTRFPGKPLHRIAGKPLLQHVWERCLRAKRLTNTIIATDDMRIAEAAFAWGAEVALTSGKHHSGTDRAAEVIARAKEFTHVINIQGDEPLVESRLIDRLVQELERDAKLEMITAAQPFENERDAQSSHQVKVVFDSNNNALYFSRAIIPHNGPKFRHQGIYGFKRELLLRFVRWKPSALEKAESLEQLRALENGVRIRVLVAKSGSPGVDTPVDAAALERILARAARKNRRR
ncbi:MAG: 3-deoxy-manno-octulosonate cytidylyltransferase [Verrucomicrobiota bacterium]|nr:3-deoxy-manno-octulosonate cytidylyltransferase [Verrucomicrobiota bacterium]